MFFITLSSCTERARVNPFDPGGDEDLGKFISPHLTSSHDRVYFWWTDVSNYDIDSAVVTRYRVEAGTLRKEKGVSLSGKISGYVDQDISYDKKYRYSVSFSSGDYTTDEIFSDTIKPGPGYLWVFDRYYYYLLVLSYDGMHLYTTLPDLVYPYFITRTLQDTVVAALDLFFYGFILLYPNSRAWKVSLGTKRYKMIAFHPEGILALVDYNNRIILMDENLRVVYQRNVSGDIRWLKVDRDTGDIFVGSDAGIARILPGVSSISYQMIYTDSSMHGILIENKKKLLITYGQGQLNALDYGGNIISSQDFPGLVSMKYDSSKNRLWLTSNRGKIFFQDMDSKTVKEFCSSFLYPEDIEVNPRNGDVYVADPWMGTVCVLDSSGEKLKCYSNRKIPYPSKLILTLIGG